MGIMNYFAVRLNIHVILLLFSQYYPTHEVDMHNPKRHRRRRALFLIAAATLLPLLASTAVVAQPGGPGGGYGYAPRGYGMMGGGSYGMMGGYGWQGADLATLSDATRLLARTAKSARVDKARNRVLFTGDRITVAMAAVQPGFPDTTFEVAGRVNPTIVVPAGSIITLTLFNMDYGYQMDHGVVIAPVPPPYPALGMMGMPYTIVGIPVLAPRELQDVRHSLYYESAVTFRAPPLGGYYYLCQYFDHASKGMYGRFIVVQN